MFLAVILQSAHSQAQMAKGNFNPTTLSVGDLFAGAFIPGVMLAGLYIVWVALNALLRPASAPALKLTAEEKRGLGGRVVIALLPPLMLIAAVLGSIIFGVATPTEAASVGAVGAILLTLIKLLSEHLAKRLPADAVQRGLFRFWIGFFALTAALVVFTGARGVLTVAAVGLVGGVAAAVAIPAVRRQFFGIVDEVCRSSLIMTTMVFVIFMGASVFSVVFTRLGGEMLVHQFLAAMPGGANGALLIVMLVMFVLGCFLDPFEIIFVVVPIVAPVLLKMDVDPIWLAVLIGVNLQTSYLTPPFGFSLFFLRGVAPPEVTTGDIYRGILPYVAIQVLCLAIVWNIRRSPPGCPRPSTGSWRPARIARKQNRGPQGPRFRSARCGRDAVDQMTSVVTAGLSQVRSALSDLTVSDWDEIGRAPTSTNGAAGATPGRWE